MLRVLALLMISLAITTQPLAAESLPAKGIVLTLNASDPDFDYAPLLEEIAATGATHVSFLIPYYLQNYRSTLIYALDGKTPSDDTLRRTFGQARALNLGMMLLPVVLLEEDTGEHWRGSLEPADRDAWFASYRQTINPLADLAEEFAVEYFSIGSEFSSLDDERAPWLSVATGVRQRFSGKLLYTANWDAPDSVAFWDVVDCMGISCYYELADPGDWEASPQELAAMAGLWKEWLLEQRAALAPDKPIILSEVGFPSVDGGAIFPWDYTASTPVDWEEQRRGFQAFITAWSGTPELEAAFIYTWADFKGDPQRGYSPRGKPAEELLRAWFSRSISP